VINQNTLDEVEGERLANLSPSQLFKKLTLTVGLPIRYKITTAYIFMPCTGLNKRFSYYKKMHPTTQP